MFGKFNQFLDRHNLIARTEDGSERNARRTAYPRQYYMRGRKCILRVRWLNCQRRARASAAVAAMSRGKLRGVP